VTDDVRLHLGCGSTVVNGWVNIDKSPSARVPAPVRAVLRRVGVLNADQANAVFPEGIVHADVRRGLAYADGTVGYVYSSHMIEHMARWQALALLRECHRVLRPGGVVRVVTPDLALLVAEYQRGEAPYGPTPADSLIEQLRTFRESSAGPVQRLMLRLLAEPHQWLYDGESAMALFREAGFDAPRVTGYRESALPEIDVLEDRDGSLFVEAARV
jgi:predicted SAM-dependent methyltransferase